MQNSNFSSPTKSSVTGTSPYRQSPQTYNRTYSQSPSSRTNDGPSPPSSSSHSSSSSSTVTSGNVKTTNHHPHDQTRTNRFLSSDVTAPPPRPSNSSLPPRNPSTERSYHASPSPDPSSSHRHRSHSQHRSNSTGPSSRSLAKPCPHCNTPYTHYRWHGPHIYGYQDGKSFLDVCPTCIRKVCFMCNGPWPCTKGCPLYCRTGTAACSPYYACPSCKTCDELNEEHCAVCDGNCGTVQPSQTNETSFPSSSLHNAPILHKTTETVDNEKGSTKNINPGAIYQQIMRFLSDDNIKIFPKIIAELYNDPTAEGWISLAFLASQHKLQALLVPTGAEYMVDMDNQHSTLVTRVTPNIINPEDKVPVMAFAIEKYGQGVLTLSDDKRQVRRNTPWEGLKNHPKFQVNGKKTYKLSYKGILEMDNSMSSSDVARKDSMDSSDDGSVQESTNGNSDTKEDEPERILIYSSTAYNYPILKEVADSISYIFSDKNLSRSYFMMKLLLQDTRNEGWIPITDILGNPRLNDGIKNFFASTVPNLPVVNDKTENDSTEGEPTDNAGTSVPPSLLLIILAVQKFLTKDLALSKNLLRIKRRSPWIISAEARAQILKSMPTELSVSQTENATTATTNGTGNTADENDADEELPITDDGKYISPTLPTRLSQLRNLVESCFNPSHINYTYTSALLRAHAERDPGAWISLQTICWLPLLADTRVVISELAKALVNSRYVQISRDGLWIRRRTTGNTDGLSILPPLSPSLIRRSNSHDDLPQDIADAVNYMLSPHHLSTHRELLQLLFDISSSRSSEGKVTDSYRLKQPSWNSILQLMRQFVLQYPFALPASFQRIRDIDESTFLNYLPKVIQRIKRIHRKLGSEANDTVEDTGSSGSNVATKDNRSPLYSPVTPYSTETTDKTENIANNNTPNVDLYLHRFQYRNGEQYLAGSLEKLPFVTKENFSVMNYNILGPHTTKNQYLYANDASLTWEHRRTRLISEIQFLSPDVITVQELASMHDSPFGWDDPSIDSETDCSVWMRQAMDKLGYDGIYLRSGLDNMTEYLIQLREACYNTKSELPVPLLRPSFPRPSSDIDQQPDITLMKTTLPVPPQPPSVPPLSSETTEESTTTKNLHTTSSSAETTKPTLELPPSSTNPSTDGNLLDLGSPSLAAHPHAASEVLGVALFWKKGTFTPIKTQRICYSGLFLEALGHLSDRQSIETYFLLARRARVGCFAALQHNATGKPVVVGATHISCCFEYPPVQMIEAQAFALTAGRLAADIGGNDAHLVPVILGADWNSKPKESLYTLMTEGAIPMDQWKVKAPTTGRVKRNFLITDKGFYTLPFGIHLPTFPYLRSVYDSILRSEPAYTNYVYRAEPEQRGFIGGKENSINSTNNNNSNTKADSNASNTENSSNAATVTEVPPKGEELPGAAVRYFNGFETSITGNTLIRHVQFRECLDFLFYTDYLLKTLAVLEVPAENEITKEGALPNTRFPSDHLPIMGIFGWK